MEELKLELDKDLDSITDVLNKDEMNPNARDNRGKVGRYAIFLYYKLGGAEEEGWTCPCEWRKSLDSSDPYVKCACYRS